jgi:hypothetical protein
MDATAPVRISLSSIAEFMASQPEPATVEQIEAALRANANVYDLEEIDGQLVLLTSREGRVPTLDPPPSIHTFAERFMTPRPKPERPAQPVR